MVLILTPLAAVGVQDAPLEIFQPVLFRPSVELAAQKVTPVLVERETLTYETEAAVGLIVQALVSDDWRVIRLLEAPVTVQVPVTVVVELPVKVIALAAVAVAVRLLNEVLPVMVWVEPPAPSNVTNPDPFVKVPEFVNAPLTFRVVGAVRTSPAVMETLPFTSTKPEEPVNVPLSTVKPLNVFVAVDD